VSFPMPQLVYPSPTTGSRSRRLTIGLQDMLVPSGRGEERSGLGDAVQIATAEGATRNNSTPVWATPNRCPRQADGRREVKDRSTAAARLSLPFFDRMTNRGGCRRDHRGNFANRGERVFRDGERRSSHCSPGRLCAGNRRRRLYGSRHPTGDRPERCLCGCAPISTFSQWRGRGATIGRC
jgi:hypothetical protein